MIKQDVYDEVQGLEPLSGNLSYFMESSRIIWK